jgi:hypothetical protein
MLSAKTPSPAEWRREAFAESFLSVKPSTRGKPPSPRGTSLSAKASNPVVYCRGSRIDYVQGYRANMRNPVSVPWLWTLAPFDP